MYRYIIQMPITDALSGTMTEVLYAGKSVVAGSWLPYNILKKHDIHFYELKDFENLPEFLESFLTNFESYKLRNKSNAHAIRQFLFPERTTRDWINLFNRILD